MYPSLDTQEDK